MRRSSGEQAAAGVKGREIEARGSRGGCGIGPPRGGGGARRSGSAARLPASGCRRYAPHYQLVDESQARGRQGGAQGLRGDGIGAAQNGAMNPLLAVQVRDADRVSAVDDIGDGGNLLAGYSPLIRRASRVRLGGGQQSRVVGA